MTAIPLSARSPESDARPISLHNSWWAVGSAALLTALALAASLWVSSHLRADPALHTAALFVHLASLVLGFGAVLVADYYGALWLLGRCSLHEALGATGRLHVPVWAGLAGLVVSGAMLQPNLDSPLTRTKLALVLALALNGLQAQVLGRRLKPYAFQRPTPRLLGWGAVTATISQVCWWGALVIGFVNSQH